MNARVALLLAACGDPAAHVHLVHTGCKADPMPTHVNVISYSPSAGEQTRESIPVNDSPPAIEGFPADTEEIGVRVIRGGMIVEIGKTAPLAFADLPDGQAIPLFMAPPNGYCQTGTPLEMRTHPIVARAGDGALVVGGDNDMGKPLSTAEYYDPADAMFRSVEVPAEVIDDQSGLRGAVLTPLPDGRVALTGTGTHVIAYFDPAHPAAITSQTLFDHRAYHAAIAPDADTLLVIGGCVDPAACDASAVQSSYDYTLGKLTRTAGPVLHSGAKRFGAKLFDLGVGLDGKRRFVLAGGTGDPGAADRFALDDSLSPTELVAGVHAKVDALDGGAVISGFDPGSGAASVLPPTGAAVTIAPAQPRDNTQLVTLEDGSVVAIGADTQRYDPTSDTWSQLPGAHAFTAPEAARLSDGSVLVLDPAGAWRFRPSLVGPQSGQVDALPFGSGEGVLVAPDPSTVTRNPTDIVLTGRVLVGGPRMTNGTISASVRLTSGGVALVAQQVGASRAVTAHFVPGDPVRIDAADGHTACAGPLVSDVTSVTLDIHDGIATATAGTAVASCMLPDVARGSWGIQADGAQVELTTIHVSR